MSNSHRDTEAQSGKIDVSMHVTYELTDKPFITISGPGQTIKLSREQATTFLEKLDSFGEECGRGCKKLRDDIRKSLSAPLRLCGKTK